MTRRFRGCAIIAHMVGPAPHLGAQIAAARRDRGLTQAACAARAGIGRTALSKVETGKRRINADELARLAEALNVPLGVLVGEEPRATYGRNVDEPDESRSTAHDSAADPDKPPGVDVGTSDSTLVMSWNDNGLGWAGLRRRTGPIGWPTILIGLTIVVVASALHESTAVTRGLTATGFLALAALVHKAWQMHDQHLRNELRGTLDATDALYLVLLLATAVSTTVYFRVSDDIREDVVTLPLFITALTVICFIRIHRISESMAHEPDVDHARDELPKSTYRWSLAVDAVVWLLVAVAVTTLVALLAEFAIPMSDATYVSLAAAAIAVSCFAYQVLMVQVLGYTLGHKVAGVRMRSTPDGGQVGLLLSAFRTWLLMIPLFVACALVAFSADGSSLNARPAHVLEDLAAGTLVVWIVLGSISVVWIRDLHPRGQGLLDLLTRTFGAVARTRSSSTNRA